jgi:uncharacterized protein (TIGR03435 family)
VRRLLKITLLVPALLMAAFAQTSGKTEFEAASIKTNEPQTGFHSGAGAVSGGPGTADPGMFRCSRCSLATLIAKAFNLQPYQFPGRTALTGTTYDVSAKIPMGATAQQFSAMLQNLLKERFLLTFHFQEKKMKGYRLVVAKDGPKLKESSGAIPAPPVEQHGSGSSESHSHSGAMNFGSSAMYRAANQAAADLALVLSDQIGLPVDDETGLTGKYDISLRWTGTGDGTQHSHSDGGYSGIGGGYAGHDGGGGAPGGPADSSAPALFDALQQQLGLKLVAADQAVARLFIVDHVSQQPTEN